MNKDFWKGKRVLISGHNGFKGSWLCLWLAKLGAHVYGFSLPNPPTTPNLYDLARVEDLIDVCWKADIRDYSDIKDCIEREKPEIIFHMAAQAIVKDGFLDPLTTFHTNILGTVNLLEACRQVGTAKSIVIITTDKVYKDQSWVWGYRETDPLGAEDPYSTSKACSELITDCYRQFEMGDLPIATARAGNVIGGGDFSYRVLPMVYESLSKKESPPIWDPDAIRPWQYVLDCLNGYMMLAESGIYEEWNFGPDESEYWTVGEIVDEICDFWGDRTITRDRVTCPVPYNLNVDLRLSSNKARRILGWKPKYSTSYTLSVVSDWYYRYYNGENARDLVYKDIEEWENDSYEM